LFWEKRSNFVAEVATWQELNFMELVSLCHMYLVVMLTWALLLALPGSSCHILSTVAIKGKKWV